MSTYPNGNYVPDVTGDGPLIGRLNEYVEALRAFTIAENRMHDARRGLSALSDRGTYILGNLVVRVRPQMGSPNENSVDIYIAKETQTNG